MSAENVPSRWANLKRPQSVGTASAALDVAAKTLRETDDAAFPKAFRDFIAWIEPSANHILEGELAHAMRFAAASRPGPLAIVDAKFPPAKPKTRQRPKPKTNGAHPPQQAKPGPRPRTIVDIRNEYGYSANAFEHFDETEELIKRLLPKFGVTMIGGQSGAGKTFFAVNMALALATGADFFGQPVREQCGVIIVAAEGAGTIAPRLLAARRAAGIDDRELLPIATLKRCPDLKNPKNLQAFQTDLGAIIRDMEAEYGVRVGIVILDTIAACFSIKDENDNAEASAICKALAGIADALQIALVPIHHFGKNQEAGFRGASAWRAGVDHGLAILAERDGDGAVSRRSLALAKSRIGEEGPIGDFKLVSAVLGIDRYGDDIVSCSVDSEASQASQ